MPGRPKITYTAVIKESLLILEYLAYVHMGEVDKAKSIAMNAIENGNTGNFVNEGKAFFEWALLF